MKILIKQAKIADPSSPFNGQTADIFIDNGIIKSISKKISEKADKEISIEGLFVSPGWVDVFAHFNDPGKRNPCIGDICYIERTDRLIKQNGHANHSKVFNLI